MAEIILFHHAGGLTAGVHAFAGSLRDAGHVVHSPDAFGGRVFADVADGVAFAQSRGEGVIAKEVATALGNLPADVVYIGMSMGAARAAEAVFARPGAKGALFLYGAIAPSWWDTPWPDDVPSQAHVTADDPWREVEAEQEYVTAVPAGELFVYPGAGHFFAEPGHADFDADAAALLMERVLTFLDEVDAS